MVRRVEAIRPRIEETVEKLIDNFLSFRRARTLSSIFRTSAHRSDHLPSWYPVR